MMWMKNTILPLDMLFVSKEGRVETLHEKRRSAIGSDHRFEGAGRLCAELNAGTIKRLAITPPPV